MGEVIHPAAPAGAEGWRKADGGVMNRAGKRLCGRDGFKCPHTPRARRGLVPGIFARDRRGPPQLGNFNWDTWTNYTVDMPGVKIRINNVVVSVTYEGTKFDLEKLARTCYLKLLG